MCRSPPLPGSALPKGYMSITIPVSTFRTVTHMSYHYWWQKQKWQLPLLQQKSILVGDGMSKSLTRICILQYTVDGQIVFSVLNVMSYELVTDDDRLAYTMVGRTCLMSRKFSWWWVLMLEGLAHSNVHTTVLDPLARPSQHLILILSYTMFHKKRNHFIFDYNSRNFWSIFLIIFVPLET